MDKKILLVALVAFAIIFIGVLAVFNTTLTGTVKDANDTVYNVVPRGSLKTPFMGDGDVVSGQELITFIDSENRGVSVTVNGKTFSTGVKYSGHWVNDKGSYKISVSNSVNGLVDTYSITATKV